MQQSLNVLEFHNVVKRYPNGVCALNGLTMSVQAGSIFGFIGLNGAGKTSTIRIIAGLSRQDAGVVHIFGKTVDDRNRIYKQEIGFVLDEPLYFDWMPARDYLHFVAAMYELPSRDRAERAGELLEFFDLAEKADEPIKTLSSGMKKKISLAAAVIHKPKMIVLDEPLEGIDALASSSIKESLSVMAAKGATILITSHVLDTVERFCDEVAILHEGRILVQCKTEDIRSRTKDALMSSTYRSLEELFVDLVSDKMKKKHLSWV